MLCGLGVGRIHRRSLPGLDPILDGFLRFTARRQVPRDQFGAIRDDLRKFAKQYLRDSPMRGLPRGPGLRLIRRFLNQGVLELPGGFIDLEDQFRVLQSSQAAFQRGGIGK